MSEKEKIDLKILENADDDMLEAMSSRYSPLDEGEVSRIFAKSRKKYGAFRKNSDFSAADEVKGVDVYMKHKWYKPVKAAVICLIVLGGISAGTVFNKKFKGSKVSENDPAPTAVSTENIPETAGELLKGSYKLTDYKKIPEFDSLGRFTQLKDGSYMGIGYSVTDGKEELYSFSSDLSEIKKPELSVPDEVSSADDSNAIYSIDPEGDITVFYYIYDDGGVKLPKGKSFDEDFDYNSFYEKRKTSYGICFYNRDGSVKSFSLIDGLEEYSEDTDSFYIGSFIQISADSTLLTASDDIFLLCRSDGSLEPVASLVENGEGDIAYTVYAPDGSIYLADSYYKDGDPSKSMFEVYPFDAENKSFGAALMSLGIASDPRFNSAMNGFGEYAFLYSDDSDLYGIKADGTREVLLNWSDADSKPMQVVSAGNDEFYGYGGDNYDGSGCNIYKLVRRSEGEAAETKVVTVGVISYNTFSDEMLNSFNRSQDKYRVEAINYYDKYVEQNGGSLEDPRNASESRRQNDEMKKLLQLDIMSGKAPDIIISLDQNTIDLLGSKGFFTDLYELMDSDPDINRQTVAPNVLRAMESKDGKLYSISPSFAVETIGIKSKYLDHENWTIQEMMDIYDNADAVHKYDGINKREMLRILLEGQSDLVDIENGQCHFDTPEFIDLLKFCNRFVTEVDKPDKKTDYEALDQYYTDKAYWIPNDEDLASVIHFESNNQMSWERAATFGEEDFIFAGYPTSNGKGGKISMSARFAISEKSKVKEGAWEFIKTYFDMNKEGNGYIYGYPSLIADLEKRLDKEMILDDYGSGEAVESRITKLGFTQYPLTQEERDDLERYVLSCDTLANAMDYDVESICYEEADAFFNGEKSAEEAARMMQNRISILVSERN